MKEKMNATDYFNENSKQISLIKILIGAVFLSIVCGLPYYLGLLFSTISFGAMLKRIMTKSSKKLRDVLVLAVAIVLYLLILFLETRSSAGGTDGSVLLLDFQYAGIAVGVMLIAFWMISPEWRRED